MMISSNPFVTQRPGRFLPCLLFLACCLQAQEPAARVGGGRGARGEGAAITGAGEDPAAVDRGAKLYTANCAGCHGKTGRGNPGAPDLIRLKLCIAALCHSSPPRFRKDYDPI